MSPADLSRLPWPLTWSCSCFSRSLTFRVCCSSLAGDDKRVEAGRHVDLTNGCKTCCDSNDRLIVYGRRSIDLRWWSVLKRRSMVFCARILSPFYITRHQNSNLLVWVKMDNYLPRSGSAWVSRFVWAVRSTRLGQFVVSRGQLTSLKVNWCCFC